MVIEYFAQFGAHSPANPSHLIENILVLCCSQIPSAPKTATRRPNNNDTNNTWHVPLFKMPATNHVYSRKLVELWTWCKNYLYPPAYKRRRAAKTLAEAYEIYNVEFSTLHRLPGELVLEVADWLDAADIASLHLSCRRHCILLRSRVRRATDGVSKEVQSRLRQDRYRRLALQEPRDTTGMDELLCSFCEDAHPRSLFPKDELAIPPFERKCTGSKGTFYICKHLSCTFTQVKALTATNGHIKCPVPGFRNGCIRPFLSYIKMSYSPFLPYYSNTLFDLHIPGCDTISRNFILDQLYALNEPLCPHMHTCSPVLQCRLRKKACGANVLFLSNTEYPVTETFVKANADTYLRIECVDMHCNTYLEVNRFHKSGGGVLTAKVHRSLGCWTAPLIQCGWLRLNLDRRRDMNSDRPEESPGDLSMRIYSTGHKSRQLIQCANVTPPSQT
jgi:hypothetical protein